jgi:hypothetical protein
MPQETPINALSVRNLALMYLGTLCGTALLLSAYVSFAESAPDSAFRHMAPARFYFFIPFFAFWALAIGTVAEILWFRKRSAPLRWRSGWLFLGVAYSSVWLAYGLANVLPPPYALPLSYVSAFLSAYLLHIICGSRSRHAA